MALVTSQGPGQPLARLWPAPTPQADAHPPHAQTPGSTETAASALLSADLWLTCPWGPQSSLGPVTSRATGYRDGPRGGEEPKGRRRSASGGPLLMPGLGVGS